MHFPKAKTKKNIFKIYGKSISRNFHILVKNFFTTNKMKLDCYQQKVNIRFCLRFQFWLFDISCAFEKMLRNTLQYILRYLYGRFVPLSTVNIFNTPSEELLFVLLYIFSEIST